MVAVLCALPSSALGNYVDISSYTLTCSGHFRGMDSHNKWSGFFQGPFLPWQCSALGCYCCRWLLGVEARHELCLPHAAISLLWSTSAHFPSSWMSICGWSCWVMWSPALILELLTIACCFPYCLHQQDRRGITSLHPCQHLFSVSLYWKHCHYSDVKFISVRTNEMMVFCSLDCIANSHILVGEMPFKRFFNFKRLVKFSLYMWSLFI